MNLRRECFHVALFGIQGVCDKGTRCRRLEWSNLERVNPCGCVTRFERAFQDRADALRRARACDRQEIGDVAEGRDASQLREALLLESFAVLDDQQQGPLSRTEGSQQFAQRVLEALRRSRELQRGRHAERGRLFARHGLVDFRLQPREGGGRGRCRRPLRDRKQCPRQQGLLVSPPVAPRLNGETLEAIESRALAKVVQQEALADTRGARQQHEGAAAVRRAAQDVP